MAFYQEDGVGLYNGRVVDKPTDLSQYTSITIDPEFGKCIICVIRPEPGFLSYIYLISYH